MKAELLIHADNQTCRILQLPDFSATLICSHEGHQGMEIKVKPNIVKMSYAKLSSGSTQRAEQEEEGWK